MYQGDSWTSQGQHVHLHIGKNTNVGFLFLKFPPSVWVEKYCYLLYQVGHHTNFKLIDKYMNIETKVDLIDIISFLKKNCKISSFTYSVDHITPKTRD